MKMRKFLIVYEKSKDGYSAYLPDLPGCTSAAKTKEEIEKNILEAIKLYINTLKEDGKEVPEAHSFGENVLVNEI